LLISSRDLKGRRLFFERGFGAKMRGVKWRVEIEGAKLKA
jgi:hypothetical protein